MRIFDLGPHFQGAFQRLRAPLRSGRLELARDELRAELTAGIHRLGWRPGRHGLDALARGQGLARLGDLVLCYQAFQQGQGLLRSLMESAGQIYRSTLFLDNLFQFLALSPQITDAAAPACALHPCSRVSALKGSRSAIPAASASP